MTTTAGTIHPRSAAAFLRTAESHELAAAVLRTRNPAAARAHAEIASGLRGKLARAA